MTEHSKLDAVFPLPASAPREGVTRSFPIAVPTAMAVTILGAVLPWATVGNLSFRGTEGGGLLNLILVGIGLVMLLAARRRAWPVVLNVILAGLAGLIVLVNLSDVGRLASGFDAVSIGSGLWVSAVGTLAWLVTSAMALMMRRRGKVG